jgi:hypothetical protein
MKIMNIPRLKITAIALLTLAAIAVGFALWLTRTRDFTPRQAKPVAQSRDAKQLQKEVENAQTIAHYKRTSQEDAPIEKLLSEPLQPGQQQEFFIDPRTGRRYAVQAQKAGPWPSETPGQYPEQHAINAKKTDSPYLSAAGAGKPDELPPEKMDRGGSDNFLLTLKSKKPVERSMPSLPEGAELKIPEEQLKQMNETALLHLLDEYKDRPEQAEQIKKILLERLEHFNKQSDANDKEASEKK